MRVLYHLPLIPPRLPQAEALFQEIELLRSTFQGDLLYVNPNAKSPVYLPRLLFGFHRLREIRKREGNFDLHHIYNPDPFPFRYLRRLRKPVVYSIGGGISDGGGISARRPNIDFFNAMGAVTVLDAESEQRLHEWGVKNVHRVRAGIDTTRFTHTPQPLDGTFRVMMASAPWTPAQFKSKGIDALLAAAEAAPSLHLVFLWRGVLGEEMRRRVQARRLEDQVTILDKMVDVNRILASVHASIVLANRADIIKAYPHSLMDSLASGKPVLVSRQIPMADYVESTGCGQVIEQVTPGDILDALQRLMAEYPRCRDAALAKGRQDFSQEGMIAAYRRVYTSIGEMRT